MPTYRCQVEIPYFTNIPRDSITNTFHFVDFVPQPLEDLADIVTPLIDTLYTSIYSGSGRAADHVLWNIATANWYDLSQPAPRAPYTLTMPITAGSTSSSIPNEVAMVASFQGERVSGEPQSRRRGRVFLGGLTASWMAAGSNNSFPRFASGSQTIVADAFRAFEGAVRATSARWVVYSPTVQQSTLITNGWVNDAPDTQRRRGQDTTFRRTWLAIP